MLFYSSEADCLYHFSLSYVFCFSGITRSTHTHCKRRIEPSPLSTDCQRCLGATCTDAHTCFTSIRQGFDEQHSVVDQIIDVRHCPAFTNQASWRYQLPSRDVLCSDWLMLVVRECEINTVFQRDAEKLRCIDPFWSSCLWFCLCSSWVHPHLLVAKVGLSLCMKMFRLQFLHMSMIDRNPYMYSSIYLGLRRASL